MAKINIEANLSIEPLDGGKTKISVKSPLGDWEGKFKSDIPDTYANRVAIAEAINKAPHKSNIKAWVCEALGIK